MPKTHKKETSHDYVTCAFQGGGALGAYQVGVLMALQEAGYDPNWYVGTSIGGINAAIAASNPPKDRIDKLISFWEMIATPSFFDERMLPDDEISRRMQHYVSSLSALFFGQPNFFKPRIPPPTLIDWYHSSRTLSYYDTEPLRDTLEQFVDFDRINTNGTRLSLGAVEVTSGKMVYFDSDKQRLNVNHVMASAALPPGFPAIEIDGANYWDGGISSNSPISYVLDDEYSNNMLCFMIHLFDSYGLMPSTLDDVYKRKKDIEFSSRFSKLVQLHEEVHALKYSINQLSGHLAEHKKKLPHLKECLSRGWDKKIKLVRFLYEGDVSDFSSKDYEFSIKSIREHIASGYDAGHEGVKKSPWLEPVPPTAGVVLHDMSPNKKIKDYEDE